MIPPSQVRSTLLLLFDVGAANQNTNERLKSSQEKMDVMRMLQKFLAAEVTRPSSAPMTEATVKALDAIVVKSSEHREAFLASFALKTSLSCTLTRILTSSLSRPGNLGTAPSNLFLKVASTMLDHFSKATYSVSTVVPLLEHYITSVKGSKVKPASNTALTSSPSSSKRKRSEKKKIKEDLEEEKNFERDLRHRVEEALSKRSTDSLVGEMAQMLLDEGKQQKTTAKKAGLIVDWLEMLDPELIQLTPEVQQQLLFSKSLLKVKEKDSIEKHRRRHHSSRPYLLTMLTHQSSWRSLRATVVFVLDSFNETLDAGAVLDFLAACVFIPKLWRGKDNKHHPKHVDPDDVLSLTPSQLRTLVDYHLAEVSEGDPKGAAEVFRERMTLLERCLSNKSRTACVVEHLVEKVEDHDDEDSDKRLTEKKKNLAKQLLLQIYLRRPNALLGLDLLPHELLSPVTATSYAGKNGSALDCVTHSLLSSLAATQHGRQWAAQMLEFEAAARALASAHPLLVLRQLPLLASSLKGRTDFDFSFFRSRNHLTLYSVTLGLLDLLRPHVFAEDHATSLEQALECYFAMLVVYADRHSSFSGVLDKFVTFLYDFMDADPIRATALITEKGKVLPELLRDKMASVSSLKQLVSSLNFTTTTTVTTISVSACSYSQQVRRDAAADANGLLAALSTAASKNSDEEICSVLQEALQLSVSRPSVLDMFAEEICRYLSHSGRTVRGHAYNLMLKYLRFDPSAATRSTASAYVR